MLLEATHIKYTSQIHSYYTLRHLYILLPPLNIPPLSGVESKEIFVKAEWAVGGEGRALRYIFIIGERVGVGV